MSAAAVAALVGAVYRSMQSPAFLAALGDDEERAFLVAEAVAETLAGGAAPSPEAVRSELDRAQRNVRIRSQFNGANYGAIAERHGLSTRQVRRVVHGH